MEHHGFGSCIWWRYGARVRLGTLILYLITSYGRWWAPCAIDWWVASEKAMVPCIRLGTLTWLLVTFCGRCGAPWVWKLHLMKIWCPSKVRYSHLVFDYILWKVMSTMCHRLVSCIWESYGALYKIRYSHMTFGYILWKMWSTMGLEVASDEDMVPE